MYSYFFCSLISELGRSPGEGNGYPLQYSCLKNSMDKGAWWARATVHINQPHVDLMSASAKRI